MYVRLWEKEVVKVLFPSLLAVFLFVFALNQIVLPTFRENLFDKKKETIREVTEVVLDILAYYRHLQESGQVNQQQAQNSAIQQIKNLRYGREKKDYFWINDMSPEMIMHPYRTDLEGKDLSSFVDSQGKKLFVDLVSIVEDNGSGYLDYMWQWKDTPSTVVPKISFVKAFVPWNWIIGTGVYVEDVEKEISLLVKKMVSYTILIFVLVCLLSFYIIRQSLIAAERRNGIEVQLRKHKEDLVKLVDERTVELLESNKQLTGEISRRKIMEKNACRAHKMEAVGTLAGGIAHDFNNILQAILGFAEISLLSVDGKSNIGRNIQNILQAGLRGRDLVSQILTFSKATLLEERRENFCLQSAVSEALRFLQSTLPANVEINQSINQDCRLVYASYTQIQQIVLNLCTNANHAMGEKEGIISVSLAEKNLSKEDRREFPELLQDSYVVLSIDDNGCGMKENTLERIFDPYFTTKKHGEGTGLGLASVLGIVKSHNGAIRVTSQYGKGSQFQIFFPVSDGNETVDPVGDVVDFEVIPKLSKNVLFVDDESMIVELGKLYLEKAGCTVTGCNSSIKAYDIFKVAPSRFDVVVTDQTMPAMTGMELSRKLLELRPDIPIILTTGYSDVVDEELARSVGIKEYLTKPLTIAQLIHTIQRVLSQE